MINLFFAISPCEQPDVLRLVSICMAIVKVIFIILPILVIIFVTIDFFKNVVAKNEEDMKANLKLAIKRIIIAIFAFFVPLLVNLVNNLLGDLGVEYAKCIQNANSESITKYKEIYKSEMDEINRKNEDELREKQAEIKKKNESKNESNTNDNENINTNSKEDTSINSNTNSTTKTIYIGDSRTVGMCNAITLSVNEDCEIAKVGQGYKWLNETAIPLLKKKINNNDSYNIVINLGTNDLGNYNKYAEAYNKLASEYSKSNIVVVSVTPIDDEKAKKYGYNATNNNVITFNSSLKSGLNNNIRYCDVYSKIINNFSTSDGIHYTNDTYKNIYNIIKSCL